jgi:hypothetical protein
VPEDRSDGTIPLDGRVGTLADVGGSAPFASPDKSSIRAFVFGEEIAGARAMGLAEDLSLLVQRFIQGSPSRAREKTFALPPSEQHGDIEIALHGLHLDPDQEAQLHHLIRELVQERVADKETSK